MNKREFLKMSLLTSLIGSSVSALGGNRKLEAQNRYKHWAWMRPDVKEDESVITKRFTSYRDAGIVGVFFEADSEKHFRIAKKSGLQAHRWIWTLNRGEQSLLSSHPEWYAVNRLGESCADKPPYVNYYRWLCPSRPEVHEYLEKEVRKVLSLGYVDGVHLDYVRFCDVVLPVNLWDNYGIEQTKELPQYDYCYCEVCRSSFRKSYGIDISEVQFPDQSLSWRKFRYEAVTRLVNRLASVAGEYKKPITAAVFPTPEVARRIVRQDWTNWNLNGIFPMIYHGFYKEQVRWIGDAVEEGQHFLNGRFPLYAGLYLPDFKNNAELEEGIAVALKNGAAGVSLFGDIKEETLSILAKFKR